jgi:hypothetical protein
MTAAGISMNIVAQDATGQRQVTVKQAPPDATVRELVQRLLARMGLVRDDASGKPLQYQARLEREGRHLGETELVGDALKPEDKLVLQPRINAG